MVAASLVLASLVLVASRLVSGLPQSGTDGGQPSTGCLIKQQRKPWQNLSAAEKKNYIAAAQCLTKVPAKLGIAGLQTRWDEFQYIHALETPYIHLVGQFFPFHRYFVAIHERALRDECNYHGPSPYWTEPQDVKKFPDVPIFNDKTGFGGNGTGSTHCVTDGPFANLTLRVNPNLAISDYCLTRNFSPCRFQSAVQANVDECSAKNTFALWRTCTETLPHAAGHGGVGALMENVELSPGDPIFFLHHTYLDKLWWDWQSQDLSSRLYAIAGSNQFLTDPALQGGDNGQIVLVNNGTGSVFLPPGGNETKVIASYCGEYQPVVNFPTDHSIVDYYNDGGNQTTLSHTLFSLGLYPNVTARDVMDLHGTFVCAEYV